MLSSQTLSLRSSEIREKLNELSGQADDLSDEQRTEIDALTVEYRDVEVKRRGALVAEDEAETRAAEADGLVLDSETRERLELRSKVRVLDYLQAALKGRAVGGAAAEYSEAEAASGDIPLSLFDVDPREQREVESRVVTGAPGFNPGAGTGGINMAPIQPHVFAPSIAGYMGIDMPMVASGMFGQARINAALSAAALAKGGASAATAATFAVSNTTPHRVSARLEFLAEDVASAGVSNFESALRQNLTMALSAELDDQFINGDGTGANISGLFKTLPDATADTAVLTFAKGLTKLAALVDGLWSTEISEVRQVVGVDTFRLAARLVTSAATGEVTLSEFLKRASGGFRTNSRMPVAASMKQEGLAFRSGRSGMRTAVCPHWGRIGITDIYTGADKAQTAVQFHVLIGDVLVIQPDAYEAVEFKVS